MPVASRTLVPLIAFLVSQSLCFQFTFPVPGKIDYRFSEGDVAVVEWAPNEIITLLALSCGPDLGIDSDTPAYTMMNSNLSSGVSYAIPDTWAESNNKYCMFCTGTFIKACSGIFSFVESPKDPMPMIHTHNGSTPQVQNADPNITLLPTTTDTTLTVTTFTTTETTITETISASSIAADTTAPSSSDPVPTTESSPVENPTTTVSSTDAIPSSDSSQSPTGNTESTTSHTTDLPPSSTQESASNTESTNTESITTTSASSSDLPTSTGTTGIGATPSSVCSLATAVSDCLPSSSTLVPTFNFPSAVPSATLQPDSGVPSPRELQSTLAGVIAIGVLALLCF